MDQDNIERNERIREARQEVLRKAAVLVDCMLAAGKSEDEARAQLVKSGMDEPVAAVIVRKVVELRALRTSAAAAQGGAIPVAQRVDSSEGAKMRATTIPTSTPSLWQP